MALLKTLNLPDNLSYLDSYTDENIIHKTLIATPDLKFETLDHIKKWIDSCLVAIDNDMDNNRIDEQTVESAAKLLSYIKKIVNEEYVDETC